MRHRTAAGVALSSCSSLSMEALAAYGLPGLFVAAFLAATILPLSSELVLSVLLVNGLAPPAVVGVATVGNVLGSLTNYAIGKYAAKAALQRWLRISDQQYLRAEQRFGRYGLAALCFAWVPVIGDPLTVIAGALRIPLRWFLPLVAAGKLARYWVLAWVISDVY